MRVSITIVAMWCLALLGVAASRDSAAANAEPQVLAKNLNSARMAGRIAAVIWTVRPERCTLQVVFPNAGRIAQAVRENPKLNRQRPQVQVWLLKANGTLIPPIQRFEPGTAISDKTGRFPFGVEILFGFPLSADKEAVAAAIRVDDQFYIEPLSELSKERGECRYRSC